MLGNKRSTPLQRVAAACRNQRKPSHSCKDPAQPKTSKKNIPKRKQQMQIPEAPKYASERLTNSRKLQTVIVTVVECWD